MYGAGVQKCLEIDKLGAKKSSANRAKKELKKVNSSAIGDEKSHWAKKSQKSSVFAIFRKFAFA